MEKKPAENTSSSSGDGSGSDDSEMCDINYVYDAFVHNFEDLLPPHGDAFLLLGAADNKDVRDRVRTIIDFFNDHTVLIGAFVGVPIRKIQEEAWKSPDVTWLQLVYDLCLIAYVRICECSTPKRAMHKDHDPFRRVQAPEVSFKCVSSTRQ